MFYGAKASKDMQRRRVLVVISFSRSFEIKSCCLVVAMSDLVHDVDTIHFLFQLLKASGNLF